MDEKHYIHTVELEGGETPRQEHRGIASLVCSVAAAGYCVLGRNEERRFHSANRISLLILFNGNPWNAPPAIQVSKGVAVESLENEDAKQVCH